MKPIPPSERPPTPATAPKRLLQVSSGKVDVDHPAIAKALASTDVDFIDGLLHQIINVGSHGKHPDEKGSGFVVAVIKGIEPRDQLETMLAAQMAAVHNATMTFARRLAHVDTIPQQDSSERAFNKLARTFAMQLEALKRYRTGGQQHVTVKHVTVQEGGQAIVGNVVSGGRGV